MFNLENEMKAEMKNEQMRLAFEGSDRPVGPEERNTGANGGRLKKPP